MILFSNFWNESGFFFWTFALIACLIAVFGIIPDLFRDKTLPGWAKALWVLFLVFIPFLGVFVYVVARGRGMAQRRMNEFNEELESSETFGVGAQPGHRK